MRIGLGLVAGILQSGLALWVIIVRSGAAGLTKNTGVCALRRTIVDHAWPHLAGVQFSGNQRTTIDHQPIR